MNAIETPLVARLRELPTAVISDVMHAMGLPDQVLSAAIRPIAPEMRFTGPALCFAGRDGSEPAVPAGESRPVFETDRRISAGCVVVIATGGHRIGAVVGGNVALSWRKRGCAGVVTDGGIRDGAEFVEMGLPTFSAFVTPLANKGLWAFAEVDATVTMPGQRGGDVTVRPGDIVHADPEGVLILPRALAGQIAADAEILEAAEARIRVDLARGEDREAVYARHDRFGHIRKVEVV